MSIRYSKEEILQLHLQEAMLACLRKELARGKPLSEREVRKVYKQAAVTAEAMGRPWKAIPIGIAVFLGAWVMLILLGKVAGM